MIIWLSIGNRVCRKARGAVIGNACGGGDGKLRQPSDKDVDRHPAEIERIHFVLRGVAAGHLAWRASSGCRRCWIDSLLAL